MGNCMSLSVDAQFLLDHVDFTRGTGRSLRRMRNMFASLARIRARKSKRKKPYGFGFSVVTKPEKVVLLFSRRMWWKANLRDIECRIHSKNGKSWHANTVRKILLQRQWWAKSVESPRVEPLRQRLATFLNTTRSTDWRRTFRIRAVR